MCEDRIFSIKFEKEWDLVPEIEHEDLVKLERFIELFKFRDEKQYNNIFSEIQLDKNSDFYSWESKLCELYLKYFSKIQPNKNNDSYSWESKLWELYLRYFWIF